ncbi:GDSL esterase/lipase-like [Dorcoceras hygrometricum]|uniref:GDSL esterase/lipase-like n=1 Tax=Dorcoceras hygrometricum TaxID=472368 RepID=A0A2Z7DKK5_9LAMI|nr:GDSL esterase/lipase-like [Dorcoceras hygrometricum]
MLSLSGSSHCVAARLVLHYLLLVSVYEAETRSLKEQISPLKNTSISAIFVFGDSTVDSGNNNFLKTSFKCNFPPYGRRFPNHVATGRFTNGLLATDFVAHYLGIKDYVPPYLDSTLSLDELKTGVSFASAGSGIDPLTAQIDGVLTLQMQLDNFKAYKTRMESSIGKEGAKALISNALFLSSVGTNDFMVNYYGLPIRRLAYTTISAYQKFILHNVQLFIQGLVELGARKIAVVGLPPIGCVPVVITLNSGNALTQRGCIESLCSVARDYNRMLQATLADMQMSHGARVVYVDIYKPLDEIVRNPRQFGFEKVNVGCCGSGLLEVSFGCNLKSELCSDDSKYVFWDAIHPTEAAYYSIFQSIRPLIDNFLY